MRPLFCLSRGAASILKTSKPRNFVAFGRRLTFSRSAAYSVNSLPPSTTRFHHTITMDAQDLKHYLADAPPSVVRLEIEKHFDPLSDKQKRYAHFISRLVGPVFRGRVTFQRG